MSPKNLLVTFLSLCFFSTLSAQICDGNKGENIFEAGDFGSGPDVVVPTNPGIAPGFVYQNNPPPNDGFYTITSDMRQWSNIFPSWDAFPDNSNDPMGYMMVVNAAFQPGLFYEQRVEGLCENTLYQFSADLRNVILPGTNFILPNVSFLLDDNDEFTTGPIPEAGRWETYGFTFTTAPGQTEVTLALRNNAPGGLGNDLAIDNISFQACGPLARIAGVEEIRVCEDGDPALLTADIQGEQYDTPAQQWQQSFDEGATWTDLPGETGETFLHTGRSSGFYFYRYLLANGEANLANAKCRVVSNVKIVNVIPKRFEIIDTICQGLTFPVGDQAYGSTGVTLDTLISSLGCDSIVTLRLTVVDDPGLEAVLDTRDPSCDDTTDGSIRLTDVRNGPAPFRFLLDTAEQALNVARTGLGEGRYAYTVTDRYGCTTAGVVELVSPNPFEIDLGPDRTLGLGEEVRLTYGTSAEIATYDFTPAELADCISDCEGLTINPDRSLTLRLRAISPAGCEFTDSLRLTVVRSREVYAPSAFSPNGDGVNDRFVLYGRSPKVRVIRQLEVFDRWGAQVFGRGELLPNEVPAGWDGRSNGQDAPAGVYHFRATVEFIDNATEEVRGSFTLLR